MLVAVSMSSRDSREDKRIFFWASVTTTTNLRVTRNTPRPKQFIDEADWAKYDVYCVGLTLYVYVLCIHVHTQEHTRIHFHTCVCIYIAIFELLFSPAAGVAVLDFVICAVSLHTPTILARLAVVRSVHTSGARSAASVMWVWSSCLAVLRSSLVVFLSCCLALNLLRS